MLNIFNAEQVGINWRPTATWSKSEEHRSREGVRHQNLWETSVAGGDVLLTIQNRLAEGALAQEGFRVATHTSAEALRRTRSNDRPPVPFDVTLLTSDPDPQIRDRRMNLETYMQVPESATRVWRVEKVLSGESDRPELIRELLNDLVYTFGMAEQQWS